jgi:Protein of unknown function (DUF4236)
VGFFIRKSFKFGPLRLNLSKRGVGVSAGVKGARVGMSAAGKPYVAGGREWNLLQREPRRRFNERRRQDPPRDRRRRARAPGDRLARARR